MSENNSKERKMRIGIVNKKRMFTEEEREVMRKAVILKYKNQPGLKERISEA
jgi:hypothetical protein